jgi:hypothetical protein
MAVPSFEPKRGRCVASSNETLADCVQHGCGSTARLAEDQLRIGRDGFLKHGPSAAILVTIALA